MLIQRSILEPIRGSLTTVQRWKTEDQGLIACWERGRELAKEAPETAKRARSGELVPLPWKGGLERAIKTKHKYGTLRYLAMWQGLRGEDLKIDTDEEREVTCTNYEIAVTFTGDVSKYADA